MSNPYLGEIRMFAGNFAPVGWAFCNGHTLSISENTALFSLLGTTYGGDGETTFNLPDLRSRIPVHQGINPNNATTYVIGQTGGEEQIVLSFNQMPQHTHTAEGQTADGNQLGPTGGIWAGSSLGQYSTAGATGTMNPAAVASAGSNQSHTNLMPYLTVNFIIALVGIFPSRN